MASVLLIHPTPLAGNALAAALREHGLEVVVAADLDAALDAADTAKIGAALVETSVLESEQLGIQTRLSVRTGSDVKVVALANLADPARKKILHTHDAILLDRPIDDIAAMAAFLTAAMAQAAVRRPTPSMGRMKVERLATTANDEPLDAPPGPDGKGPLVLVVDDEEDCRTLFETILTSKGYRVHTVSSASSAIRFLGKKTEKVSLIVSDIRMPQMDGFELKQEIDGAGGDKIPFLAVAGDANPEQQRLAAQLGIVGLVAKPIQVRAFCKIVRSALVG